MYARMNDGLDPLEVNIACIAESLNNEELWAFDFSDTDAGWFEMPAEFALAGSMDDKPVLFEEAMVGPDASEWKAAWDKEIGRLEVAHTWDLVYAPQD